MKCYRIKIKNDADWLSDGQISIEVMVLADDFLSATVKGQDVTTSVVEKLETIVNGDRLGKDLDTLRLQEVVEMCPTVVDGIGDFSSDRHSIANAVEQVTKRLEKRKISVD